MGKDARVVGHVGGEFEGYVSHLSVCGWRALLERAVHRFDVMVLLFVVVDPQSIKDRDCC